MKRVIRLLLLPFVAPAGAVALILLLPLAALSIPWTAVAIIWLRLRERKLRRQLEARHRIITWEELEKQLYAGAGTLIIEHANKVGVRFWWTPDDLLILAPTPPISTLDEMGMDYIRGTSENPFVHWCYQNYLSITEGVAFLTHSIGLSLPPGPLETNYMQSLYPKARIVQTVLRSKTG